MYPELRLTLVARLNLAAASGIRRCADRLYVVADDELHLGVYDLNGAPCGSIALRDGALPHEHAERKAHKPDFEALLSMPDGALVALGSGSTPRRRAGVRIELAAEPRVCAIDLSELYLALERVLPELNIEGAAVWSGRLWLCSRGNSERRDDALIELDLAGWQEALLAERAPPASLVRGVTRVGLGDLLGAPLSLTDLSVLRGKLVFSAAAEASENTYDDGVCTGSVIGVLSALGLPQCLEEVAGVKIEGVCPAADEALYLVADADARGVMAPLFRAVPSWVAG